MAGTLEDHPKVGPVNPVFSALALVGILPFAAGVGPSLARFVTGNHELGNSALETGLIVGGVADFIFFGVLALMFRSQARS
jgi:hypothetical protein